jgi:hypothetical protein
VKGAYLSNTIAKLTGIRDSLLPAQAELLGLQADLGSDLATRYGATYSTVETSARQIGYYISELTREIATLRRYAQAGE